MMIDALVEGLPDEAVARRLVAFCNHKFGICYGKAGFGAIQRTVVGFNARARAANPILALVDWMDVRAECPARWVAAWVPNRSPKLLLRAVIPELESWLLADRSGMAAFLGVSEALLPRNPEQLVNPKEALVNLARRSRRRFVREALIPQAGSRHVVGPGYTLALEQFVAQHWNPATAAEQSASLRKCLQRLHELAD